MTPFLRLAALAGLAGAFAATPALAQRSYPTCAQAQASVQRAGAAVIHTAPGVYDRYVAHPGFCPQGDYLRRAYVATRDTPACFVGYTCVTGSPWEDGF
jgi:hypothetical protein